MNRLTEQHKSDEPKAGTVAASAMVQRLRLQAALVHQEILLGVVDNAILMPFSGFWLSIVITPAAAGFAVDTMAHLGRAMLADEARRLLATSQLTYGGRRILLTDDGELSVRCRSVFAGPVYVPTVLAQADEIMKVAFRLHKALAEDCYLRSPELPDVTPPRSS